MCQQIHAQQKVRIPRSVTAQKQIHPEKKMSTQHKKMIFVTLYLTPILIACSVSGECTPTLFLIGTIPLLVALPAYMLHVWIKNDVWEHIGRHALFTIAFISGAITLDWKYITENQNEEWATQFVSFFVITSTMLFYFTIVHTLEVYNFKIKTHHGDVTILPLLLITITMFYNDIPDDAFLLSRSAILSIPILVAWTTILLIAFFDFVDHATSRVRVTNFGRIAAVSLFIATVHLILLELAASVYYYFAFTISATIFIQFMRPIEYESEKIRRNRVARIISTSCIATVFCCSFLFVTKHVLPVFLTIVPGFILSQEIGLYTIGIRWPIPTMLLTIVPSIALLYKMNVTDPRDDWTAVFCLCAVYLCGGLVLSWIQNKFSQYYAVLPALPIVPRKYDPPQFKRISMWDRIKSRDFPLPSIFCKRRFTRDEKWLDTLISIDEDEGQFNGVWWMKDNTMGMHLIVLSQFQNTHVSVNAHYNTTRDATLLGFMKHMTSFFLHNDVTIRTSDWVQTSSFFNLLGLTREKHTLWIYTCKSKSNEMMRLQFDENGSVAYQYYFKRIAYIRNKKIEKTSHFQSFMQEYENVPFLFSKGHCG